MEFKIEQIIHRALRSDARGFLTLMVDVNARSVRSGGRSWSASNLSFDTVQDVLHRIVETRLKESPELVKIVQDEGHLDISGARSIFLFSEEELEQLRAGTEPAARSMTADH
jgi:hypothetical protein